MEAKDIRAEKLLQYQGRGMRVTAEVEMRTMRCEVVNRLQLCKLAILAGPSHYFEVQPREDEASFGETISL